MSSSGILNYFEFEEDEMWEAVEEEAPPTAAEYPSVCTASVAKEYATLFKVPPEYHLSAPNSDQRAHSPPAGYAAVYFDHFKSGLTLPLPPFVVSVLNHYKLALAQLHPNGVFNIVGFIKICEGISVVPTTGLFRHCFTLGRSLKTKGWYTFFAKRPGMIVHGQPHCVKHWKKSFLFFKTAPMSENSSLSWNHSPVMNPPLAEDEKPSAETISMLMASAEDSSKRKSGEQKSEDSKGATENADHRQKRMKKVAEFHATEQPAKSPSVPSFEGIAAEHFASYIQNCVSSFHLKLQGDKEQLEKIVAAKEQDVKDKENQITLLRGDKEELQKENDLLKSKVSQLQDRENEIASLQGDKEELEKVVEGKKYDLKDRENKISLLQGDKMVLEKENASLKAKVSQLQGVSDDRGPLLKVYTWKLLKTQGFAEFFYKLTTSGKRLGLHEAAERMQRRYPDIPEEALADLEDPLAALKLDNLFYDMIQDDGFEFPLLNHLLSLDEIPSSTQLKDLAEDEDPDALIAPSPLPF